MKKLIFALVSVMLLVMSSMALAASDEGTLENNGKVGLVIDVNTEVEKYAQITMADVDVDNFATNFPIFEGKAYESKNASGVFEIKTNTLIDLLLRVNYPFTHQTVGKTIDTEVTLKKSNGDVLVTLSYDADTNTWGPYGDAERLDDLQDWGSPEQYSLTVTGSLGDIHEQPAGDYAAQVTLTISAAI